MTGVEPADPRTKSPVLCAELIRRNKLGGHLRNRTSGECGLLARYSPWYFPRFQFAVLGSASCCPLPSVLLFLTEHLRRGSLTACARFTFGAGPGVEPGFSSHDEGKRRVANFSFWSDKCDLSSPEPLSCITWWAVKDLNPRPLGQAERSFTELTALGARGWNRTTLAFTFIDRLPKKRPSHSPCLTDGAHEAVVTEINPSSNFPLSYPRKLNLPFRRSIRIADTSHRIKSPSNNLCHTSRNAVCVNRGFLNRSSTRALSA